MDAAELYMHEVFLDEIYKCELYRHEMYNRDHRAQIYKRDDSTQNHKRDETAQIYHNGIFYRWEFYGLLVWSFCLIGYIGMVLYVFFQRRADDRRHIAAAANSMAKPTEDVD